MAYSVQPLTVGSTADFTLYARKDGVVWDITGATVLLYFRDASGTALAAAEAFVSDGPAGKAHYQCTEGFLDASGDWERKWKVSKSGVVLYTKWIPFYVAP